MIGGEYGAGALSVSELNEYARKLLASDPLLRALEVSGEISGYKHHVSGHRYFSLKDESARVQCVMFRQQAMGLDFRPADGMRVTVRASASIYPQNGSFQLYVTAMRQSGQGDLYIRFEKLKQMYNDLPDVIRLDTINNNRKELKFVNNSRIIVCVLFNCTSVGVIIYR